MEKFQLEVSREFKVPAKMIYEAWLDPQAIKEFMKPGDVVTVPAPEVDARVGGAFLFKMHVGENILPHKGEYKVLNPHKMIQFSWNSMNTNNEDSIVTINIESIDEKSCRLNLTHEKLPTESSKNDHEGGWSNILKHLDLKVKA